MTIDNDNAKPTVISISAQELFDISKAEDNSLIPVHLMGHSEFASLIDGEYWIAKYRDIGLVGIRNLTIKESFINRNQIANLLSFEYLLSGGSDMELNRQTLHHDGAPKLYAASYLKQGTQTRIHRKGEVIKGLGLWLDPQKLTEYLKPALDKLPPILQELLSARSARVFSMSLEREISEILNATVQHPFEGHSAKLYQEAKLTELLCYSFKSFYALESDIDHNMRLSQHKSRAIAAIINHINCNLAAPSSIDELAAQVGLSRSNLLNSFKESCGMSFSEYVLQQRMLAARNLIKNSPNSIVDISLAVGYKDQSAFGRAYKRYFSCTPRQDRN